MNLRFATLAVVWSIGFFLIGIGQVINYAVPGYSALNHETLYPGDWVTVSGFSFFILAAILRVIKDFRQPYAETEMQEVQTLTGREFRRVPAQTFLDIAAHPLFIFFLIIAGGILYSLPELTRREWPGLEGLGGFILWMGLGLLLWKLLIRREWK